MRGREDLVKAGDKSPAPPKKVLAARGLLKIGGPCGFPRTPSATSRLAGSAAGNFLAYARKSGEPPFNKLKDVRMRFNQFYL